MLRYDRHIKPGLVALYDIWPGNSGSILTIPEPAWSYTDDDSLICLLNIAMKS